MFPWTEPAVHQLGQWSQYAGNRLYLRPYTKNPFSSLIETPADGLPATVFVEHHYRIDDYAPVQNVKTRHPMWLQVVHGGNVLNEIVGLRTTARRIAPPTFPQTWRWRGGPAGSHRRSSVGGVREDSLETNTQTIPSRSAGQDFGRPDSRANRLKVIRVLAGIAATEDRPEGA